MARKDSQPLSEGQGWLDDISKMLRKFLQAQKLNFLMLFNACNAFTYICLFCSGYELLYLWYYHIRVSDMKSNAIKAKKP